MASRHFLALVSLSTLALGCSETVGGTSSTTSGAGGTGGAGGATTTSSVGGAGGATTTSSVGGAGGATTTSSVGGAGGTTTTTVTGECATAADCPGVDTDCRQRACVAAVGGNVCTVVYPAPPTPVTAQTMGDCAKDVCDGAGSVILQYDETDPPAGGACPSWTACGVGLDPTIAGGTALWTKHIGGACPPLPAPPLPLAGVVGAPTGGAMATMSCGNLMTQAQVNAAGALGGGAAVSVTNLAPFINTLNERGDAVHGYTHNFQGTSWFGVVEQRSQPKVGVSLTSSSAVSLHRHGFDKLGNLFVVSSTLGTGTPAGTGDYLLREGPSGSGSRDLHGSAEALTGDGTGGALLALPAAGATALGCNIGPGATGEYLVRLGISWSCVWARSIGATQPTLLSDGAGGVIVSAGATSALDLGCGVQPAIASGSTVVSRIDAAGNCVYTGSYPIGSGALPLPSKVVRTLAGGVAMAGLAGPDPVDLGGGALAAQGARDVVIAVHDAAGQHLSSHRFGATGVTITGAELDAAQTGHLYLRLRYAGSIDFGGGPVAATAGEVVVVSLTAGGAHRWSRALALDPGMSTAFDGCGSLYSVRWVDPKPEGAVSWFTHFEVTRHQP